MKKIEKILHKNHNNTNRQVQVSPTLESYMLGDKMKILMPDGTMTEDTEIIYLYQFEDGTFKLGQLNETKDDMISVLGRTGPDIWVESYRPDRRAVSGRLTLVAIIYVQRSHWLKIKSKNGHQLLLDDQIRSVIRKLNKSPFRKKRCPFSANVFDSHCQGRYLNKEHLVDFDLNDSSHMAWVLKILLEILELDPNSDILTPMMEKDYQEGDTALITAKVKRYSKVLLAAFTSYGKTVISLNVAVRFLEEKGGGFCVVTTPRTDTLNDFENNAAHSMSFGTKKKVIVIHYQKNIKKWRPQEILKAIKNGHVVLLLVSVQGVRHKDSKEILSVDTVINKWKKYFDIANFWIRDEKWTEYNGVETRKAIKQLETKMPVLDLAATTSKIRDEYDPEAIVDRSIFWAMKNPLCQLPSLMIKGINWPASKILDSLCGMYMQQEEFTTEKLILPNDTKDGFINQSVLETLPDLFYRDNPIAKKLGISIVDSELCDISKRCGLWVMPEGVGDWSTGTYLPLLADIFNKKFGSSGDLYIDSYSFEKKCRSESMTANEYMEHLLDQHSRVVLLTHGKFTVGTSIDRLGHIVLLCNISSGDLFEQLLGRLLRRVYTKDEKTKTELNIKTNVLLITLVPDLKLKSTLATLVVEHCEKSDDLPQAKEYFDLLGFRAYDIAGKPMEYSGQEIVNDLAVARALSAGSGLASTQVSEYLEKSKTLEFWKGLDTDEFGFRIKGGSVSITDENNGRNAKNNQKNSPSKKNGKQLSIKHIQEIINETYGMVKLVSVLANTQSVKAVINNWIFQELVGKKYSKKLLLEPHIISLMQEKISKFYKYSVMTESR
jgi:hypothetical protein